MDRVSGQRMGAEVAQRLAALLALPPGRVKVQPPPAHRRTGAGGVDLLMAADGLRFAVEYRASGQAAAVVMATRSAREGAARLNRIPLVVVPYMGEVGRNLCEEAGVGWLDLSGNAHLVAPGIRVHVEGKPNQFKQAGRPRSVFAQRSARIARWLLIQPEVAVSQRALARATGLDEGFTSRIVHQLEAQGLVARDSSGAVKVANYAALLEAWREAYDFSRHHIVRGHIAARSSDELLRRVAGELRRAGLEHAATGLAGAWLWSGFAGFRLVVMYVAEQPEPKVAQAMGFHATDQGENVWLVRPQDAGVFQGGAEREGIACVHPVQVYLDLKEHPERSAEAAEVLRKRLLAPTHD